MRVSMHCKCAHTKVRSCAVARTRTDDQARHISYGILVMAPTIRPVPTATRIVGSRIASTIMRAPAVSKFGERPSGSKHTYPSNNIKSCHACIYALVRSCTCVPVLWAALAMCRRVGQHMAAARQSVCSSPWRTRVCMHVRAGARACGLASACTPDTLDFVQLGSQRNTRHRGLKMMQSAPPNINRTTCTYQIV